jgi:hypothetical protein
MQTVRAGVGDVDGEAFASQPALQGGGKAYLVFDDQ